MNPTTKLILILLFFHLFMSSLLSQEKQILSGSFAAERLKKIILTPTAWHPFPKYAEREGWSRIGETVRNGTIAQAEKHLHGVWQIPEATDFLEYTRNGNRSRYEAISFGRREQLAALVLGECMEGKGRFLGMAWLKGRRHASE